MKKIEISTLVPLPYNPRTIDPEAMARLKVSIKDHSDLVSKKSDGFRLVSTVTVNKNGNRIVGGHQRVLALRELGQDWISSDDVTFVDVEPDSAREKALSIILNSDKYQGEWDDRKLEALVNEIHGMDGELFDDLGLGSLGDFGDSEIIDGFEAKAKVTGGGLSEDSKDGGDKKVKNKYTGEPGTESLDTSTLPPVPPPAPGPSPDDNAPVLFPVSYAVTADQRKMILDATAKAREKYKLETSAEALSKICEEFLK